jgi:hypothetical protein
VSCPAPVYVQVVVAPEVDNAPVLPHGTAAEAIAAGPTAATHPLANPTTTKDRHPVDRHPRTRIASPLSASRHVHDASNVREPRAQTNP